MSAFARLLVVFFLSMVVSSAVRIASAPWDCFAQHWAGWPFPRCTVVNCSDTDPCEVVGKVINGIVYATCGCISGTPTGDTCWAYWEIASPPNVFCVNAGCPVPLTTCRKTARGAAWTKVCDCEPFAPI